MQLVGTNGKTATAVIDRREQQRQENGGHLVRPPIHPARFAAARMEHRPGTVPFMNPEMDMMRRWLIDLFEAGGTRADLRRAWETWQPTFPRQKAPLTDHFESLCLRADAREMELITKAGKEGEAERHLQRAHAKLERAEAEQRECVADLKKAQAGVAEAKREVAAAERLVK